MNFYCAQCGAMVAAADVNLDNSLAKCRQCQNVFSWAEVVRREKAAERISPSSAATPPHAILPRPPKMQIEDFAGVWSISWRWFSPVILFLVFFCVIWDGIIIAWYAGAMRARFHFGLGTIALLFPIVHVSIGIGLTYYTICGFVNRTRISLISTELRVEHGPLPWPGARYARSDLRQLFCKELVRRGRDSVSVYYDLLAVLNNGEERKLISGMTDVSEARFLEQQLERRMGIIDEPVAGEHR